MHVLIGDQKVKLTKGANGRLQATFTATENTHSVLIPSDCIGTLNVNDIQLEQGSQATPFVKPAVHAEDISGIFKDLRDLRIDIKDTSEVISKIDDKADEVSVDELIEAQSNVESLIEQYPTPESLNNLYGQFSDVDAYTKHLEDAMESNRLDGLERFKIIEENVGSGQKFMQAISQYLSYSEEGLVLGQEGNALKISIDNERISFLDSGKEVAYINGQMLYILSGVFLNSLSIGNHKIEKLNNSNKITTITWIGGS